ncbi:histidine-type phosphatase [Chryseobacterium shigense]|uniref:Multiple inositol polyphosphate phosphatase 1 n=1 Tax=Chryseobacterium shigense TaxID=297244 RepID=A0A841ND24_9FLAO|nr:histidine-type phosphatase [Chryseobacterium shigense]MBB6371230.1 hypothetical protein [Chryseobacterium shigense]
MENSNSGQMFIQDIFDTPEQSGGISYAYPLQNIRELTPLPDGYIPFYISHFGRHGSRYLVDDNEYKHVLDTFRHANSCDALTSLGRDLYERLKIIWSVVRGNGGNLTPLGIRQLTGIAERMQRQYPEVFTANAKVTAVSTTSERCIYSMEIFCGKLKELCPGLHIAEDADPRHMDYLNYHTKEAVSFRYNPDTWIGKYKEFEKEHVNPDRLITALFSDEDYVKGSINPVSLIWDLYNIAGILQNMDISISLYDLFEKKELFDLWQCKNYSLYVQYANAAENQGMMMENAKPLLKNIIESADHIIETKDIGASFRFGHDGNIIPLAMLLHLQDFYNSISDPSEFYNAWNDFKVSPMAANIQIIFFRNEISHDVLVKFLHNEQEILIPPVESEILPYYRWQDLKEYYNSLLSTHPLPQ